MQMSMIQRLRNPILRQSFLINRSFNGPVANQMLKRTFFISAPRFNAIDAAGATNPGLMSGYTQDNIIFQIQSRCTTVQKLVEFEEENQGKLTYVQQSVLLARLRALLIEQGNALSPSVLSSAQNLFQNTGRHLLRQVNQLDVTSLASTINVLSKGSTGMPIESVQPDQSKLAQIEQQIIQQFDLYLNQDISVIVASMIKLGYTPKLLLEAINKMSQMSTFSKEQSVRMLEALVDQSGSGEKNSPVKQQLFDKFFMQLEKHALKLNSYNVCRAFYCLHEQSKIENVRDNKKLLNSLQMRANFLVDRMTEMLSRDSDVAVLDLYWSNKLASDIEKVLTPIFSGEVGYIPLDLRKLQLYSVQELQEHISSADPKVIVNMIDLFENERHKQALVQKTLDGLRSETVDIRKFQLVNLAKFIGFVAVYQPDDVKVFHSYVMMAFNSGFFTVTPQNFLTMSEIFYMFVKNGFVGPEQQSKFLLSYLLALKQKMLPAGGKEEKLDAGSLIKITWSLVVTQKPGTITIPLLPKLFEQLAEFERPDKPLSQDELLMLHQIKVYVQDLVSKDKLPAQFNNFIPEAVSELAANVYEAWDQPLYPDVQKEIAIKLLRLRVDFKQNARPSIDSQQDLKSLSAFRVPFQLATSKSGENGMIILLQGDQNMNKDTDQWFGLYGFVARVLEETETKSKSMFAKKGSGRKQDLDVRVINTSDWQDLDEVAKMEKLSALVQSDSGNQMFM